MMSALLLVLGIGYACAEHTNFQWTDCGKWGDDNSTTRNKTNQLWSQPGASDALVRFHQIDISPVPIVLSKTNALTLTSNVSIEHELPSDAFLELEINKTINIGGSPVVLTLPCVDGLGSCAVKVCDLWSLWYNDIICPFFKNVHRQCSCPIKSGQFVSQNVKFEVPFGRFQGRAAEFASVCLTLLHFATN